MEKKLDLRVQRTYKMLTEALMECLQEKNFDEITVGEICEKAMVRRATFYKHFGDKFELFAYAIQNLQEQFKEEHDYEYTHGEPKTFILAMIDSYFQFVEQHSDIFHSVIQSSSSKVLLELASDQIQEDLLKHLEEKHIKESQLPVSTDLFVSIATGAVIYAMEWWLLHDKKMPREELTKLFGTFISNLSAAEPHTSVQ